MHRHPTVTHRSLQTTLSNVRSPYSTMIVRAARLRGTSDAPADPDHHVRLYVNGGFVGEASWDGKRTRQLEVEVPSGLLREGSNEIELENVGDTEAPYSLVMLDRFTVTFSRRAVAEERAKKTW